MRRYPSLRLIVTNQFTLGKKGETSDGLISKRDQLDIQRVRI